MVQALFLFFVSASAPVGVTVAELHDGIEQQLASRRNLEFTYSVDAKFGKSGSSPEHVVKSTDILRILDSDQDDIAAPWRYWQRSVDDRSGSPTVARIVGFDGLKSALYEVGDVRLGIKGGLSVQPYERTFLYDENLFELFLSANGNGLTDFNDPGWVLSRQIEKHWELIGSGTLEGHKTHILKGHTADHSVTYEIHTTGAPHYFVVRRETRLAADNPSGKPHLLMKVDSLKSFGETLYPAAGTFEKQRFKNISERNYRFTVTSVRQLDDSARASWIPTTWPSGTIVTDRVNNTASTIPFEEKQFNEMDLDGMVARSRGGSSGTAMIVITSNFVLAMCVLIWIYLKRKSSRKAPKSDH